MSVIWPDKVFASSLFRFTGGEGTVEYVITAPLPCALAAEDPILLVATTLAHTLDDVVKLKGADIRVVSETVQLLAAMTLAKVPSQLGRTSLKVCRLLCLRVIV